MKTNSPCRAHIYASFPDGRHRSIKIPRTGYGGQRHGLRWLARGAYAVTVWVDSLSTGRNVSTDTYLA